MTIRVLLVDDYEPWRRLVAARLQKSLRWEVVGEASDGLDAIHKTEALRPDLILLDIGLPMLSGLEAARQILTQDPDSRILFLSENSSSDIVEAALETGGRGYVLKSEAARELLPAMKAVVEGRRFVSPSLTEIVFANEEFPRIAREPARHEVAFYSDNASLLGDYGRFSESALKAGKALIVVSRDIRRRPFEQELTARGIDVARLTREGKYRWLDVSDALSSLLVENWPDEERFWDVVPPLIMEAARASTAEHSGVAAWGECSPTLCAAGKAEAAIRLEQLWDDLGRIYGVDIFCAYPAKGLFEGERNSIYDRICRVHSLVHS